MKRLRIGELARHTGLKARTIRYYEAAGVLPTPERDGSGYRTYSTADVRRLEVVRLGRRLGMPLPQVRELVRQAGNAPCHEFQAYLLESVRRRARQVSMRIAELEQVLQDLRSLEATLMDAGPEDEADHTAVECPPETCACLGRGPEEVKSRQAYPETEVRL